MRNLQNMKRKIITYLIFFSTLFLFACNTENNEASSDKYQLEIKPIENKSAFEKAFPYIKDSLSVIAVFLGIFITYPLLRKKLVENHITNTLQKIQDTNGIIQSDCQKIIDKYVPLTYSNNHLRESDIEKVYDEIRKLSYEAQQASSDVVTILFYFKNTLQGVLKHYDYGKYSTISSRDLYGLTISVLELTIFYCTKVISIPKSTKIESQNIINPKIKKFVTNSNSNQFKYFNQGFINDVKTSHLGFFYQEINSRKHALIKRAAFKTFQDPAPVAVLLFLSGIYAPLVLEKDYDSPFNPEGKLRLFLIGFSFQNKLTMKDGTVKEVIDLDYCNPDDFGRFADNLKFDDFKTNFYDSYIRESNFKFDKISMKHSNFETITIQIDSSYLKTAFKKVKRKMRRQMMKNYSQHAL